MADQTDFDGCARACHKPKVHTLVWGECAFAEEPEPWISIGPRTYRDADGELSIGYDTYTLTEMTEKIEEVLRSVPVNLSGCNYSAMAYAVAIMLTEFKDPGQDLRPEPLSAVFGRHREDVGNEMADLIESEAWPHERDERENQMIYNLGRMIRDAVRMTP